MSKSERGACVARVYSSAREAGWSPVGALELARRFRRAALALAGEPGGWTSDGEYVG